MKLDIGCGIHPHGDINCDLYIVDVGHREKGSILNVHKIKNFVLCDSQYLPFKDFTFNEVYSNHVIEHVKNPYKFLHEAIRVCKNNGVIHLRLPHRFSYGAKNKGHINFFNIKWFEKNVKHPIECYVTKWSPFKFFLFFPNEIQLKIFKRREHYDKNLVN